MAIEAIGADLTATRGTSVTPNASANTKGTPWTQLVASSTAAAKGILVLISGGSASSTNDYLVDIGIGAAAAETVVVANLPHAGPTTRVLSAYYIPVPIASGTRISARCQCGAASAGAIFVMALLLEQQAVELQECTRATTYGAITATTRGTSIDPGTSGNTKGGWTEIDAACANPIDWLVVMAENLGNTAAALCEWLVDIGTGAAAAETVVVPNLQFQATTTIDLKVPQAYPAIPLPSRISAGTRIAARAQCNITTATARLLGLVLIGADGTSTNKAAQLVGGGLAR